MSEPTGARRYGVGGGDAYYDAVRYGGYEGTREQFGKDQAEFAKNASAVAEAKETVERDTEEVRNTKNTFENTTVPEAIRALNQEGEDQIKDRDYASPYANTNKKIITAVFVADDKKRQIVM